MSTFSPNGVRQLPPIVNEPIRSYAPGSPERASLQARIKAMEGERPDIAVVVHGEERRSGKAVNAVSPHKHQHVTATWHHATAQDVHDAIESGKKAYKEWSEWTWEERAAVFLKAADLLAGPWRDTINAATMLGQSKNVFQSEIDAACEMTDFFRFNVQFARELYSEQPISGPGMWNQSEYRALEGFVYAVTPFNFTAIGGNLAGAPALMGNTVLWKPAASAMLSAWYTLQLLHEAGLPKGVINFLPGDPVMISDIALKHRDLAGVHFTGSTGVFNSMWNTIGTNMSSYRSYPRIVGETGGKDFMIAHASADVQAFAVGVVRGAFEYQGQKCSACSRIYVPKSIWPEVKARITAMIDEIKVGDTNDFSNFMGAVIDQRAFDRISGYLADAKQNAKVIAGGTADGSTGWFVKPTLVETTDPKYRLMCEEIFGPIVTAYVYDDAKWEETLKLVDETSPYALTGAVFAQDRSALKQAHAALRHAAGNFYINDKCTGAVVGQQPFGGARASGTNDKAGSKLNLLRWVSARTVKETFVPPRDYKYPHMG
ncbi:L-glutamate gamma-semialdehyde dehydrogenase [Pseudogemmatithrix spongiicola]|uniref:L-glutamate gamma-semialdehyde dehydrogenase n=1 Tax=Pseudogemmatithrix spongiicola TaxID=3062599 RepID=A0AA49JWX0_9BACT|nr:L-glutamate gamma-semialdehyde dehydrogenase [Gemmatimonadaceae bacterium 'strain 138']WKW16383.1 L-glutamate gamma-semialdehyde dehydrogenase [Gemmatimonadaceae bacterium 'strain 318']